MEEFDKNNGSLNEAENEEKIKLGWKDIIAMIIALFEIVMPIALIAVAIFGLLAFGIVKLWFK